MNVVVVGGGIIGLFSAYALAKRGHPVTLVDRRDPIRTSLMNAGMIVPSHVVPLAAPGMVGVGLRMALRPRSPFWIRPRVSADLFRWGTSFARHCTEEHVRIAAPLLRDLHLASREAYFRLERELEGFLVERRGLLAICQSDATLEAEDHEAERARSLGLRAERLDLGALRDHLGVAVAAVGAIHHLDDAHFDPAALMAGLDKSLATVSRIDADAIDWVTKGDRIASIRTREGEIRGDAFVLAAGAWSSRLARPLGIDLRLQAGKGYSFDVADAGDSVGKTCALLVEARVAVTPMADRVRFGGTMEIGPLDGRISPGRVEAIRDAAARYYPGLDRGAMGRPVSVGLRPCSPDGLPYLGFAKENLVVATGHAMMGMSLGPISGEIVADLLSGQTPAFNLRPLDPLRFTRPGGRAGDRRTGRA